MFMFDSLYLMCALPGIVLGLLAQWMVSSAFRKWSSVGTSSGMSGAEAARYVLDREGLQHVKVLQTEGFLSDHYDPSKRELRLSPNVYSGRSVASVGVAAHEAGHALQHATHFVPLHLRTMLVPTANFGSWLAFPLVLLGLFFKSTGMINFGIIAFTAVVIFQLITLPVEFDASSRAKRVLLRMNVVGTQRESAGVASMLNAAALTYVAAAVAAIGQLLYLLALSRRRD